MNRKRRLFQNLFIVKCLPRRLVLRGQDLTLVLLLCAGLLLGWTFPAQAIISSFPHLEDFETAIHLQAPPPPANWSGTSDKILASSQYATHNHTPDGAFGIKSASSPGGDLISDTVNYAGYINADLSFWLRGTATSAEWLKIYYSINGGADWTLLGTIDPFPTDGDWHEYSYTNIIALDGQSNCKFKWEFSRTDGTLLLDDVNFTATSTIPTVTTQDATNVTASSATLNCNFSLGEKSSVDVYFQWKEDTGDWTGATETTKTTKTADGSHTASIPDLAFSTTYKFRGALDYNSNTIYSLAEKTFTTSEEDPQVVINELYYDPTGAWGTSDTNHEFIELYNSGGTNVDLTGWQVQWGGDPITDTTYAIPSGTIEAGKYFLIGGSETFNDFSVIPDLINAFNFQNGGTFSDGVRIWNGGSYYDTVLYDSPNSSNLPGPNGTVDDGTTVGTELCPDVDSGHSLSRKIPGDDNNLESDWEDLDTPTPHAGPDTTAPVMSSAVADDASGGGSGIQAGDQVVITFSEPMDSTLTIDKTNIDAALPLDHSHTWLDGSGNIGSVAWSGGDKVLTITLNDVTGGKPDVAAGDTIDPPGSDYLKDVAGNNLDDSITITGSFDPLAMRVNYVFWGEGDFGDCIFIELPGADGTLDTDDDKNVLIDGGYSSTTSDSMLDEFLTAKGVTKINHMVMSHPGSDHYYGLYMVVRPTGEDGMNLPVDYFYEVRDYRPKSTTYDALRDHLDDDDGTVVYNPNPGDYLSGPNTNVGVGTGWDLNLVVKCLAANTDESGDNNCSMILMVKLDSSSFLFGGDAQSGADGSGVASAEQYAVDYYPTDLANVHIYKVHHHGADNASGDALMGALTAIQYAVQQDGGGSAHPYADALGRIKATAAKIYRNDLDGDVLIKCDDQGNYDIVRSCLYPPGKNPSGDWQYSPPALPENLSVTDVTANSITLDWDDVSGATYDVFRSTINNGDGSAGRHANPGCDATGIYEKIAEGVTVSNYTDDTVSEGITYYYRVSAIRTDYYYERRYSNEASGTASTGGVGAGGGYGGYGGCFIASAAYGGYTDDHRFITDGHRSQIIVLQRFRDERLLTNSLGRAFVRFYYRHSPRIADFIRDKGLLKAIIRAYLRPLVEIVDKFQPEADPPSAETRIQVDK